jgi:HEAT repeat protein
MKLFGKSKAPDIEKMAKQRDVEGLIRATGTDDADVRNAALKAIGNMDTDPRVKEALIAALKDKDWRVRCGAALALTTTRDPRAVEPLVAALKDENPGVRFGAANALALTLTFTSTDCPDAVTALTTAVAAERDPEVKRSMDGILHSLLPTEEPGGTRA